MNIFILVLQISLYLIGQLRAFNILDNGIISISTANQSYQYSSLLQNIETTSYPMQAVVNILSFKASSLGFSVQVSSLQGNKLVLNIVNKTNGQLDLVIQYLIFALDYDVCLYQYLPSQNPSGSNGSSIGLQICQNYAIYPNGKCLQFLSGINPQNTQINFQSTFGITSKGSYLYINDTSNSNIELQILCVSSLASQNLDYYLQESNQNAIRLEQNPLSTQSMLLGISGQKVQFNIPNTNRFRQLTQLIFSFGIQQNQDEIIINFDNTAITTFSLLVNSYSFSNCPYFNQYQVNNICYVCHPNCLKCFGPLETQCYSCQSNLFSYKIQSSSTYTMSCLTSCPSGTYSELISPIDINYSTVSQYVCTNCKSACKQCSSLDVCTQCESGYYLMDDTCLFNCPLQYYGDTGTSQCLICHTSCRTCNGPLRNNCITCDYGSVSSKGFCNSQAQEKQEQANQEVASYTTSIIKYGFVFSIGPLVMNSNFVSLLNFIEGIQAVRYILYINIEYHEVVVNFFEQLNPFTLTFNQQKSDIAYVEFPQIGSTPAFYRDNVDALYFKNGMVLSLGFCGLMLLLSIIIFAEQNINKTSFLIIYITKIRGSLETESIIGYLYGSMFNFSLFTLLQLQDSSCQNWMCFCSYITASLFIFVVIFTLSKLVSIILQVENELKHLQNSKVKQKQEQNKLKTIYTANKQQTFNRKQSDQTSIPEQQQNRSPKDPDQDVKQLCESGKDTCLNKKESPQMLMKYDIQQNGKESDSVRSNRRKNIDLILEQQRDNSCQKKNIDIKRNIEVKKRNEVELKNNDKEEEENSTVKKYEFLFEEIETQRTHRAYFILLLPVRVTLTSLNLVLLYQYPLIQLLLQQVIALIEVILILKYQPYKLHLMNIREGIQSLLLIVIHSLSLYQLNEKNISEESKENYGWKIIYCCLIIGIFQLLVVIQLTFISIKKALQRLLSKYQEKLQEQKKKKIEQEEILKQQIEKERQLKIEMIDQEDFVLKGHINKRQQNKENNDKKIEEFLSVLEDQIVSQTRQEQYIKDYQLYKLNKELTNIIQLEIQNGNNLSEFNTPQKNQNNEILMASFDIK